MTSRAARRPRTVAPVPLRLYRVVRASLHVVEGLATTVAVFPFVSDARRRALTSAWSHRLLRQLGVRLTVIGGGDARDRRGYVVVANHVSWLDIVVLNAMRPSRFVAKSELKRWPVLGWLIVSVGTLFIERERRLHTRHVNDRLSKALEAGDVITVFPEARTSDGSELRPFHASLLQPAIDAQSAIRPIAIRYESEGERTDAPAYVGDMGLVGSVWRVATLRTMDAKLHLLTEIAPHGRHRRELATLAHAAIRSALGLARDGSAPGRSHGPRDASP